MWTCDFCIERALGPLRPILLFFFCFLFVSLVRPDTVAAAGNDAVDKAVAVKAAAVYSVVDKAGAHKADAAALVSIAVYFELSFIF